jgi:hypothetical protein
MTEIKLVFDEPVQRKKALIARSGRKNLAYNLSALLKSQLITSHTYQITQKSGLISRRLNVNQLLMR